jgi:hypothetical protein
MIFFRHLEGIDMLHVKEFSKVLTKNIFSVESLDYSTK